MMYPIFGACPAVRMIDWLIDNQQFDHSLREIADGAGIPLTVAKRNFEPFVTQGVIVVNRTIRRDPMYVLDMTNPCTKAIIAFDAKITECCRDKEDTTSKEMDEVHERFMAAPPE